MTKRILLLSSLLLLSACQQNNEAASIVNKQESDFEFTLPELAAIPAGEFDMGCVSGIDCADREEPVHSVTIPAFLMSKTEITADLWDACVKAQACQQPYDSEGNNRPATYTSWDDVQTFITWINTTTGENYRLPSESEWEYAARAGSVTPYSTGDCISTEQANYEGNAFKAAGCTIKGEYRDQTTPVASFSANAFGLHDMHGNMWEWVEDCWHDNYDGAPADGSAWVAGDCERRVMRGGAWHGDVSYMRSAYRFRFSREGRSGGLGFRLAKSYEN